MNIVLVDGFIATNIGNAFFSDGIFNMLKTTLPEANLYRFGDVAAHYWGRSGSGPENEYPLLKHVAPDYVVVTGPMLTTQIEPRYARLFEHYNSIGTKIALISCGGYTYDSKEVSVCRKFLNRHKVDFLCTRDAAAFECYKDLATNAYDGICGAWTIPDYFRPLEYSSNRDFITLCFDTSSEPEIEEFDDPLSASVSMTDTYEHHLASANKSVARLYRRSSYAFDSLASKIHFKSHCVRVGKFDVVRPVHSPMSRPGWMNFAKPGSYASDMPEGYLNLYSNSTLTLTDRVHAAVASLAQGTPAQLCTRSNRAFLFEKVGAEEVTKRVIYADQKIIANQKSRMASALADYFNAPSISSAPPISRAANR